jgi:hypothetical protein
VEVAGRSGLVSRRHHLHRRDIQERREADFRQGRRAIDLHEGDEIDEEAFKTLVRAAAAFNRASAR